MGDKNEITKDDLPEEVVQYIGALEDEVDDLTQELDASKKAIKTAADELAVVKGEVETLKKSVTAEQIAKGDDDVLKEALSKADPAVRAVLEKQAKRLEEAETIAKAERDARIDREMVAKAETLPMIDGSKQDKADMLKALYLADPELATKVEHALSVANTQIAKSNLFTEFGKGGAETTVSSSVKAKAAELRKADPSLTAEQAETLVYQQNPDLYIETLKEG